MANKPPARMEWLSVAEDVYNHGLGLLSDGRSWVNVRCRELEAFDVILITILVTFLTVYAYVRVVYSRLGVWFRIKMFIFRLVEMIPPVRRFIDKEMGKTRQVMESEIYRSDGGLTYLTELPSTGWDKEKIIKETDLYVGMGSHSWSKGRVSGTVYNYGADLEELATHVFGRCAWANLLHPDVFPGVRKMEAEIIMMLCKVFNGGKDACGVITSGGTESIVMACKAYRDRAFSRGIDYPEIIAPITAHAAFDKAAELMNVKIHHIRVNPNTMQVDVRAVKSAINKNTCMLVVSAPHFPHGIIDPIQEVAQLGLKYDIPVHVDSCLGGFLLPFMEKAGYPLPPFDFRVKGVTSISADTHKYGSTPKGTSVLLYRNAELRRHQYFVQPDWPGGIYATSCLAGSRSGGIVATCWATLLFMGMEGYIKLTRDVISTSRHIIQGLNAIPNIYILGNPQVSVIALGSKDFNIYRLSDMLAVKGWNLNALQFPSSIHFCVTMMHTADGVADAFITDVRDCVTEIMKDPLADKGGKAAIYGMAQSIPDRSMVGNIARIYLDVCYGTRPADGPNGPAVAHH